MGEEEEEVFIDGEAGPIWITRDARLYHGVNGNELYISGEIQTLFRKYGQHWCDMTVSQRMTYLTITAKRQRKVRQSMPTDVTAAGLAHYIEEKLWQNQVDLPMLGG